MQLVPDWAPNIHPMIVHFPIVLLILAVLFDFAGVLLTKFEWIKKSALLLYLLGTIAAAVAFITGNAASDSINIPANAFSAVNEHADWAETTLWFFVVYTIVRLLIGIFFKSLKKVIVLPVVLIGLVGIYFLYQTGDHGAKLVFGYGLGTGNIIKSEKEKTTALDKISLPSIDSTFSFADNGSWRLTAGKGILKTLSEKFKWVEGSLQELNPMYEPSESILMFHLDKENPVTAGFVYDNKIKSVQAALKINIDDFNGELELVHNFVDKNNYDFLGLKKNEIYLARKSNGEVKIFEKNNLPKTNQADDWLDIKVVSEGTHFRGYINDKLYVHGHGNAPASGSVGMKFSGTGIISIKMINVESL